MGATPVVQIADKFEHFLKTYRRPDGSRWGGQDLHDGTGGIVTRSYVSNLRKGRIENPGFEKLRAIAEAMNFPPELWFEDVENEPDVSSGRPSWFLDRDDKPTLLDAAIRGGAGYERRTLVAFGGLAPFSSRAGSSH